MPALSIDGTEGGVPYSFDVTIALDGGVREAQPYDGPRAHVVYQCPYGRRYQLLQALLPYGRNVPHAYPPSPNLYAMECTGIEGLKPKVDDDGWMVYEEARVGIEYRCPTWQFGFGTGGVDINIDPATPGVDPSGQPWTTTSIDVGGEVLRMPQGTYVLEGGTPIEESAQGLILPQFTIRVRRHYVVAIPLAEVEAIVGGVNEKPVKIANKVFAKGTLMIGGMNTSVAVDTTGQRVSENEYVLLGRGRGKDWNKFLAPDGTWKLANTAADLSGEFPYPYIPLHATDGLGEDTTFLGLP